MKKIFLAICILISVKSFSQLEGINVNLTLRAGDWCFLVGTVDNTPDSLSIVTINRLRDTMQLANPATFNTNVRYNNIPAIIVYRIYTRVKGLPSTLYDQVGTNISTQIKAIVNTPLQTAITAFDNHASGIYTDTRRRGKNFLSDN
jgi:hypothetical protein